MDKNKAVWNWIQAFSDIKSLYFNFGEAKDGSSILIPNPTDDIIKTDICGVKKRRYDFAYSAFSDVDFVTPFSEKNIASLNAAQAFSEWIKKQNEERDFPDFGKNCCIDNIKVLQNAPAASLVDGTTAKYFIQCRIEYEEF